MGPKANLWRRSDQNARVRPLVSKAADKRKAFIHPKTEGRRRKGMAVGRFMRSRARPGEELGSGEQWSGDNAGVDYSFPDPPKKYRNIPAKV